MHSTQTRDIHLHHLLYAGWLLHRKELTDIVRLMFSSTKGWITFMLNPSASKSRGKLWHKNATDHYFTIYCNSETSSPLSLCSILICVLLCSAQMRFSLVPHKLMLYCMREHMHSPQWALHITGPHADTPLFLHILFLEPTCLFAVTSSQCAFIDGSTPSLIYNFPCSNHQWQQ